MNFDSFVADLPKDCSQLDIGNGYKMFIHRPPGEASKVEFLFYGYEPHRKNGVDIAQIYFGLTKTFYYTNIVQLNSVGREVFFDYLKSGHPRLFEWLLWRL